MCHRSKEKGDGAALQVVLNSTLPPAADAHARRKQNELLVGITLTKPDFGIVHVGPCELGVYKIPERSNVSPSHMLCVVIHRD